LIISGTGREFVPTIVMMDPQAPAALEPLRQALPGADWRLLAPGPGQECDALLSEADFLLTRWAPVTRQRLALAPRLKLVQRYGRLLGGIDLAACEEAGVPVARMPLWGAITVAEHAFALLLAVSRRIVEGHLGTASGAYRERGQEPVQTAERLHRFQWLGILGITELHGKRLGIVGLGEIGLEMSQRARAFGMDVTYYRRRPLLPEEERLYGLEYRPLPQLFRESDVISLHLPHTPETEGMINAQTLAAMKPGAILVNAARGGLVDEAALVEALRDGRLAGAGLDVFRYEPLPADSPLCTAPNVVLAPHTGGGMGGTWHKAYCDCFANMARVAAGLPAAHLV
jgi:phosphoglycerate dehydrogenase-like enzyme